MGDHSGIQWTNATWNPVVGCTRASRGCDNCYAAREAAGRLKNSPVYQGLAVFTKSGRPAFNGTIRLLPERLDQPIRWKRPRIIFVNSMSDLFHPDVPDEFIAECFAVMAIANRHTFQVLTKRPERAAELLSDDAFWGDVGFRVGGVTAPIATVRVPLPNVWIGTSVEDQAAADDRIPHLLRTPAAIRFLSCEPLLGPVDLARVGGDPFGRGRIDALNGVQYVRAHAMEIGCEWETQQVRRVDWVIVGGESGPRARPCDVDWIRSIVAQCRTSGVPVFVKQLGAHPFEKRPAEAGPHETVWTRLFRLRDRKGGDPAEWPEDLRVREWPRFVGVSR